MNKFRPFFAVFLLLALLCGCAAPHEVTTVSLPDAHTGQRFHRRTS